MPILPCKPFGEGLCRRKGLYNNYTTLKKKELFKEGKTEKSWKKKEKEDGLPV